MVERLAYPAVLERAVFQGVQGQVGGADPRVAVDGDAAVAVELLGGVRGESGDEVDAAALQGGQGGRGVGGGAEDEAVDGRASVPVAVVGAHPQFVVALPAREGEGAGADGVVGEGRVAHVGEVAGRYDDAAEQGEFGGQDGVVHGGVDVDGEPVDDGDALDEAQLDDG